MILLRKWDYAEKDYKPFISPAKTLILVSDDMDDIVDCANCGQQVKYGDTYTSKTIHKSFGIGFPVCEKCYEEEIRERELHHD